MIKHDQSNSARRSSKSNSAPSSPVLNRHSMMAGLTTNEQNGGTTSVSGQSGGKKLRSSLSSNRIEDPSEPGKLIKPIVKKKLAFSDDEILNDQTPPFSSSATQQQQQQLPNSGGGTGGKKNGLKLKTKIVGSSGRGMSGASSEFETDYESNENLSASSTLKRGSGADASFEDRSDENGKHKRSSSLTKMVRLGNYNIQSGKDFYLFFILNFKKIT